MPSRSEIAEAHGDFPIEELDSVAASVADHIQPGLRRSMATSGALQFLGDLVGATRASQEPRGGCWRRAMQPGPTRGLGLWAICRSSERRCWRMRLRRPIVSPAQHPWRNRPTDAGLSRERVRQVELSGPRQVSEGPHRATAERSSYEQCRPLSLQSQCSGLSSLGGRGGFRSRPQQN